MGEETPYERVKRRRAEGAAEETLALELSESGLAAEEIALLLGHRVDLAHAQRRPDATPSGAAQAPVEPPAGPASPTTPQTPWELVKKLRGEGFPRDAIAAQLAERGLSKQDVAALLLDEPLTTEGEERPDEPLVGPGLQLALGGVMTATGVFLLFSGVLGRLPLLLLIAGIGRLGTALGSDSGVRARRAAASRALRPLADDDPKPRCGVHPRHASIGACPRCGTFACAMCTPARGYDAGLPCLRCAGLPEVRRERLAKASKSAAGWLLVAPAAWITLLVIDVLGSSSLPSPLFFAVGLGAGAAPWLVLALVQRFVHHSWPTWAGLVLWALVFLMLLFQPGAYALAELAVWVLPLGAGLVGWLTVRQAREEVVALVPEPVKEPVPATA